MKDTFHFGLDGAKPLLLRKIVEALSASYDVACAQSGPGSSLYCALIHHSRAEKYVLSRKAQLWAAETNDYAYLYAARALDEKFISGAVNAALSDALPQIKPHREHMVSYITVLIVCDGGASDCRRAIRRARHTRNYRASFHGWSSLRLAVVDMETGKIYTNGAGRTLKRQLRDQMKGVEL